MQYATLERADEPVEVGTPINKVLFDSIKNDIEDTGAYSESQIVNMSFECTASSGWENMVKGEVISFKLRPRRFYVVKTKLISAEVNVSLNEIVNFFIIDTKMQTIVNLNNGGECFYTGMDFTDTPNVYEIGVYKRTTQTCGIGIAFVGISENNTDIQLGWKDYGTRNGEFSVQVDVCELLANKEG